MASLNVTRSYDDGEVLVRADLDAFLDDLETFFNATKINDDNIQNSGITGSTKLLNGSVTASKLGTGSVTTAKLDDLAVTSAKIANGGVATINILDANVTVAKLATDSVSTIKIIDANVTTGKLANDAVTNPKLADDAVQTENILASAVTTAKINDGAVTNAKMTPAYSNDTLTGTNVVEGSVSYVQGTAITTVGRPVTIGLYGGSISATCGSGAVNETNIGVYRYDTVALTHTAVSNLLSQAVSGTTSTNYSVINPTMLIDTPSAGTYQYEIRLRPGTGVGLTDSASCTSLKMLVYEV